MQRAYRRPDRLSAPRSQTPLAGLDNPEKLSKYVQALVTNAALADTGRGVLPRFRLR
jgi:hypothetical protein